MQTLTALHTSTDRLHHIGLMRCIPKTVSGPDGLDAITGVTSAYTAGGIATPTPAATDDGTTTTDGATDLTDTTETSETTAAE